MAKKLGRDTVIEQLRQMALGRSNDAVKLAFLQPEQLESVDGLDLRMVSEIKRGSKGEVEVKLISRLALLELLAGMLEGGESKGSEAESFFNAMDKAAARLGDGNAV